MRADCPRGDLQRTADFLVRLPRRDHSRNLHFASGQPCGSGSDRLRRRTDSTLAHLFTCAAQLVGRTEPGQHVVRFLELAPALLRLADLEQCAGEPAPNARGLWWERNRLELLGAGA